MSAPLCGASRRRPPPWAPPPRGTIAAPIHGVSIDTRTLAPGDLFFAIKGENRDGHDFVDQAMEKGATAVVSIAKSFAMPSTHRLLVVEDPFEALRRLGRAARARTKARLVAVTGSVGKTGTKEALRHVLGAQGKTHAPVASYNNHWGVPLTLARLPQDAVFAVSEIGMNAPGEIRPLAAMVRPHAAIVTTVEPVHLEFFPSVAAIADAKAEIFSGLEPGGTAIINIDNPQARKAHGARAGEPGRAHRHLRHLGKGRYSPRLARGGRGRLGCRDRRSSASASPAASACRAGISP